MSKLILLIAATMMGMPFVIMGLTAAVGFEIPLPVLWLGGWVMALGVVIGCVGLIMTTAGR